MSSRFHDRPTSGISGPYDDTSQILSELTRPRPVRMSFRGKLIVFFIPAVLVMLVAVIAINERSHPTPGLRAGFFMSLLQVACILSTVLGLIQSRIYVRQKRLVSEGELGIGRVTEVLQARFGGPYVTYEIETPSGERLSKIASNNKANLSPGMTVPVFYDRENPKKQVVLCAAFYEVVSSGKG